jgi:hypothetical protein
MIKTSGHKKAHYTFVLACFAEGIKLPSRLIFKRKTITSDKIPQGSFIHIYAKGWMDADGSYDLSCITLRTLAKHLLSEVIMAVKTSRTPLSTTRKTLLELVSWYYVLRHHPSTTSDTK